MRKSFCQNVRLGSHVWWSPHGEVMKPKNLVLGSVFAHTISDMYISASKRVGNVSSSLRRVSVCLLPFMAYVATCNFHMYISIHYFCFSFKLLCLCL